MLSRVPGTLPISLSQQLKGVVALSILVLRGEKWKLGKVGRLARGHRAAGAEGIGTQVSVPPELKDLTSAVRLVFANALGGVTEGAGRGEF